MQFLKTSDLSFYSVYVFVNIMLYYMTWFADIFHDTLLSSSLILLYISLNSSFVTETQSIIIFSSSSFFLVRGITVVEIERVIRQRTRTLLRSLKSLIKKNLKLLEPAVPIFSCKVFVFLYSFSYLCSFQYRIQANSTDLTPHTPSTDSHTWNLSQSRLNWSKIRWKY